MKKIKPFVENECVELYGADHRDWCIMHEWTPARQSVGPVQYKGYNL